MAELHFPAPPLADERVTLRPWRTADAAAVAAWGADPDILRWTNVPRGYDEHGALLHQRWTEELRRSGTSIHFAIADAGDDTTVLGSADVRLATAPGIVELGYLVDPRHRGRGVATGAVRLMTGWAVGPLGARRVQVLVHPDNAASRRVAERAGFAFEGILRAWSERNGLGEDRAIYALVPSSD